jgi:hypothetical protein
MDTKLKMVNDPNLIKRLVLQDKELLAQVLEFMQENYGEIYKQILIEKIKESLK